MLIRKHVLDYFTVTGQMRYFILAILGKGNRKIKHHTSTYEYIQVTYGYIQVHTSNIRVHTSNIPVTGYQFMFHARMCRSLIFDRVGNWDQRTVHSCAKHKLITQ